MTPTLETQFEHLIDGILANNYGLIDGFLADEEMAQLARQLHMRRAAGQFHAAGTGNGKATVETAIRGDEILWLDAENGTSGENTFLERVQQLIDYLNQTCYLGLRDYELHYALYPAGTFYKRHLDRFRADSKRKLSLVCYLNHNWQPTDGGQLTLYLPQPNGSEQAIQVAPLGGRLVCFDSGLLEHEVLPATRDRLSLTGWLRTG